MADPRYRPSGRRSPTFNPARASMPVNIGYNPPYNGDIHAIPTSRYDTTGVRRPHDHKAPVTPAATITTYNVTKDPLTRSASTSRHRASTAEPGPGPVKPIIVTTNHARPHASSAHTATTSSSGRTSSPSRDAYRSSEETYYTQPASSVRSRSQHRQSHSYSQSATLSNDEFYRLRERVGEERLRAPARAGTDSFRHARPISLYAANPPPAGTTPAVDYEDEGYEYTKPSDLARYDLTHEREAARRGRRESIDRSYHRPHVNVTSNDPASRYEPRNRAKPPPATGIDRYNRAAAAGVYDRPSVTMPAPPAVPPPPMVEAGRRPALLEAPSSPTVERRSSRPRPVSLYQESPARASHPDELYRARDDERLHRRERDDTYRDDAVAIRGFGIRTDTLDQPARPSSASNYRDQDDPRPRRDGEDHEPKRRSDESLPTAKPNDEVRPPTNGTHRRESMSLNRKNSISERARERFTAGLAAMGIGGPKEDTKPAARRNSDEEKEPASTRPADRYKPQDKDALERRPAPREDLVVEPRREPRRERAASVSSSRERVGLDRERDKSRDRERGREREKSRDREQYRRDAESKLNGSTLDPRDISPVSIESDSGPRRRPRSASFNPTDAKGLMNLKAELAAREDKVGDRATSKDVSEKDAVTSNGSGRELELSDESRGRELVPAREEKQVRVVSPPREKGEQKPLKGILKTPSAKFPEDNNPVREGVAPHKDDKTKKDVPNGARWTKISRRMVNPEALSIGKERFEVRDDFVIVLRVLSKDEIQAYAIATAQLRELRRKEHERETRYDRYSDEDRRGSDEERRERARYRREEDDEYRKGHGRDREDRHRRHRVSSDDEDDRRPKAIEYETSGSNHRTYRDHDSVTTISDDRR
ncbi:hypothetical protein F4810DRAFT_313037 [Camillea tinctor]|nr:hypothetical protein F4810DRAFT_313037 [Camillea tinctor]